MLRILCLTTLFPNPARPGHGVNVERQIRRLSALPDIEIEVIAPLPRLPVPLPAGPYRAYDDVDEQRRDDAFNVHHPRFATVPAAGWITAGGAIARAALPLARRLHAKRPFDLVTGEFFFPDAWAVHKVALALHLPYVIKARGSDIRFWSRRERARRQMVGAGRHASGLLAVSRALLADMAAMGLPAERIDVNYTGVELSSFRPDAAPARQPRRLVAAGNLVPLKRHDLLLQAMTHLPDVELEIIGDGPLRAKLEQQAKALGLAGRVTFAGALPHGELPARFASAALLIHTSSSEGLANVWVEALACGTPVLTTDVGGAREVIDRPAAGVVVPADISPYGLASAIGGALAAPADPEQIRERAQRFSWDRNLEQLRRIYLRAAGKVS